MVFSSLVHVFLLTWKEYINFRGLTVSLITFVFFILLLQPPFWLLCFRGLYVIATPYASGFDHFLIADEVQFKFDRCFRFLQEPVSLFNQFILLFNSVSHSYAIEVFFTGERSSYIWNRSFPWIFSSSFNR